MIGGGRVQSYGVSLTTRSGSGFRLLWFSLYAVVLLLVLESRFSGKM